jgi:hypothetical protein
VGCIFAPGQKKRAHTKYASIEYAALVDVPPPEYNVPIQDRGAADGCNAMRAYRRAHGVGTRRAQQDPSRLARVDCDATLIGFVLSSVDGL